jgi:hypothetical protein
LRDVDRARRRVTYEDLLKVPDTMVAEILEGELYATVRVLYQPQSVSPVSQLSI